MLHKKGACELRGDSGLGTKKPIVKETFQKSEKTTPKHRVSMNSNILTLCNQSHPTSKRTYYSSSKLSNNGADSVHVLILVRGLGHTLGRGFRSVK